MKTLWGLLVAVLCVAASADAALIAYWNFPSSSGTSPFAADSGVQQATATLEASAGFTLPAGTTVNQDPVSNPGATFDLSYTGGPTPAGIAQTVTLKFSGTGLQDFNVSYAGVRSAGPGGQSVSQLWEYSTDSGANWSSAGITQPAVLPDTAFAVQAVDLTSISAIEGAGSVWLRLTATSSHKDNVFQLDNFQVSTVPEPVNVALGLFGLFVVTVGFSRRICGMVRV